MSHYLFDSHLSTRPANVKLLNVKSMLSAHRTKSPLLTLNPPIHSMHILSTPQPPTHSMHTLLKRYRKKPATIDGYIKIADTTSAIRQSPPPMPFLIVLIADTMHEDKYHFEQQLPSNFSENKFHDHSWLFMEIPDHNKVR